MLATLALLHSSGPLGTLVIKGPVLAIGCLVLGVIVTPFFRGPAGLGWGNAYAVATGALILSAFTMLFAMSLIEAGRLDDRWLEPRFTFALVAVAATMMRLGTLGLGPLRALRLIAVLVGGGSALFIGYIFAVN